jgi:hypothetical protein
MATLKTIVGRGLVLTAVDAIGAVPHVDEQQSCDSYEHALTLAENWLYSRLGS